MNEKSATYNTGETEQQLRQTYNPDGSTLRRAQLRLMEMARYLRWAAQQAGVPCRLDGGNVLGALRHGGFIPWDDDMDFVVEQRHFHRLCQWLKEHPHPQFVLQDHSTDAQFYKEWATLRDLQSREVSLLPATHPERKAMEVMRFQGLHIDIFPYEPCVVPLLQRLAGKLSANLHLHLVGSHPHLAEAAYQLLHHAVFPLFRWVGRAVGSPHFMMHSYGAWFYERNPTSAMLPHRPLRFEGEEFEGPACPEELCRIAYGNYMNLPPKEKRQRHQMTIEFLSTPNTCL